MVLLNALSNTTRLRSRSASAECIRRRALERLYQRRQAVNALIDSLERYHEAQADSRANLVAINSLKRPDSTLLPATDARH